MMMTAVIQSQGYVDVRRSSTQNMDPEDVRSIAT